MFVIKLYRTMEQEVKNKFRYLLRNKSTDQISFKWYTLTQIEVGGLRDLFNLEDYIIEGRDRYTGLKDKNGKGNEVFEGDLFEVIFSNVPNGYAPMGHKEVIEKQIGEIVFHFGSFMLKVFHPEHGKNVFTDLKSFLENEEKIVFGNKFQHPELLNKKL